MPARTRKLPLGMSGIVPCTTIGTTGASALMALPAPGVTLADKRAITKDLLRSGANIYFMAKMAIPRGTSVQDAGAQFQGITTAEFQAKLSAQAEGLIDKLKAREGYWIG